MRDSDTNLYTEGLAMCERRRCSSALPHWPHEPLRPVSAVSILSYSCAFFSCASCGRRCGRLLETLAIDGQQSARAPPAMQETVCTSASAHVCCAHTICSSSRTVRQPLTRRAAPANEHQQLVFIHCPLAELVECRPECRLCTDGDDLLIETSLLNRAEPLCIGTCI